MSTANRQSSAEYAFWQTQEADFTVTYSLPLFHEIDFVVNEGYRSIPHGGVEVGGLLFGRIEAQAVRIEAYRSIECEHAFGPSFVLSDRDLERIEAQLSASRSDSDLAGLEPVGWFVAHTRKALELTDREADWFNRFFPSFPSVAVLVKPERFQPTRFAFVVRRADGQLQRETAQQAIILPLPGRGSPTAAGGPNSGAAPSIPAPDAPAVRSSPANPRPQPPAAVPEFQQNKQPAGAAGTQPAEPLALNQTGRAVEMPAAIHQPAPAFIEPAPSFPAASTPTPNPPAANPSVPNAPVPAISEQQAEAIEPPLLPVTAPEPDEASNVPPPSAIPEAPPAEKAAEPASEPTVAASAPPVIPVIPAKSLLHPNAREVTVTPSIAPVADEPAPASGHRPLTRPDAIWRQRVESVAPVAPSRPAAPNLPPARRRHQETRSTAQPRFAIVFLLAGLLGCCVGYLAYLQLPPAVIPITVKSQAGSLVLSWPAAQTEHVADATVQVGNSQPVVLSQEEKSAGELSVQSTGDDVRIELVARHWPRDSRGIVRVVRSLPPANNAGISSMTGAQQR
ncbi:MAG: hypothetical protein JOY54_03025 [Acidobacteriaceae bacterium]|nr:hypothetical protein [Acidobacteriaceae bacterium]